MLVIIQNNSPYEAGYEALRKLHWKTKKEGIFIKPNIGATSKFVNTDPEIVRGIIHYCKKELGITNIAVGEGAVETEYESTPYNFHYQGWDKLAEEENVELIDLNKSERFNVNWKYGKIALPTVLQDKAHINAAKMKTHMQTLVSLCAKNQKGLLNSETRKAFHRLGLHEPIAELAKVLKPDLCLVDGIVGIEGNGPGELGIPKEVGIVVAGDNMVEVDKTCCKIMGINPEEVKHLNPFDTQTDDALIPKVYPFKRPDKGFRMLNVYMRPENACTACMSSVGKMNKLARRSWKTRWLFFQNGILHRLDIVIGNPPTVPENHGKLIFYGNCTREIAKNFPQYPFIKGCPPISKEALEELANFVEKDPTFS